MARVRARARASVAFHRTDRGHQNPSDIRPGSPNRWRPHIALTPVLQRICSSPQICSEYAN